MKLFNITLLELMFLADTMIPPQSISRSICFDSFSDVHYHNMTKDERIQFFNHVQKHPSFNLENEQCRHFFSRFNPKNQYHVSCFHNGKADIHEAYMFNEEYITAKNKRINPDYIKSVVRNWDSKLIK